MSNVILAICLGGSMVFGTATTATAQTGTSPVTPAGVPPTDAVAHPSRDKGVTADTAAGYDARALRLESHWGDFRIIRGAQGPVVGTVGLFRSFNVEKLVAGSREAETEARTFRANHRPGAIAGTLGALTFGIGLAASSNSSNNAATPILVIAGVGTMMWGAQRLNSAYAALSRSLWWYNRDLVR